MKDIIIISMSLAIALGGCTRSINPEYEPFIEELERTDRIYDLSNASDSNICRLAELVDKEEGEMLRYKNFGTKSLTELVQQLDQLNLKFGMDVSQYLNAE